MLTQERLKELLNYDPETGEFTRRISRSRFQAGGQPGWTDAKGYLEIEIDGRGYRSHRLAWLYMTGVLPTKLIDHRDTNKKNNIWNNLREVTTKVNSQNRKKANSNNRIGMLGVHKKQNGSAVRFCARIRVDGRLINLGSFHSAEMAHAVYLKAKRFLHEGCTI